MTFYPAASRVPAHPFPRPYLGDVFAAEHGSWNRRRRVGYKVIRYYNDDSALRVRGEVLLVNDSQPHHTRLPDGEGNGAPIGEEAMGSGSAGDPLPMELARAETRQTRAPPKGADTPQGGHS